MAASRLLALTLAFFLTGLCHAGVTSPFVRKLEKTVDMPLDSDVFRVPPGYNAPQQVHITQGNHDGSAVIVSWVTESEAGSGHVRYGTAANKLGFLAKGHSKRYDYFNYTSGFIHHCTLRHLKFDTKYFYEVGIDHTPRKFSFKTPPEVGPDVPYTFGLMGNFSR